MKKDATSLFGDLLPPKYADSFDVLLNLIGYCIVFVHALILLYSLNFLFFRTRNPRAETFFRYFIAYF